MPIIEQPGGGYDDFYSPDFLRFAAGGFAVLSAGWAVLWFWFLARGGCVPNGCARDGQDDLGASFGALIFFWPQLALMGPATAGLLYLLVAHRSHRLALAVNVIGLIATAVFGGLVYRALARS